MARESRKSGLYGAICPEPARWQPRISCLGFSGPQKSAIVRLNWGYPENVG